MKSGATFLHVVDLDGALAGKPVNLEVIREIRRRIGIPIEVGGGIRTAETAEELLGAGITRVIVGTRAAADPDFMRRLVDRFGADAVVAGIDAKDGFVAVEGWEKVSSVRALDLCLQMKADGIRHVVYTDISRDGMMGGPNVAATAALTADTGLDVIASGGISSLEDLAALYARNISGAIIGKALYEKKIDLRTAILKFQQRNG